MLATEYNYNCLSVNNFNCLTENKSPLTVQAMNLGDRLKLARTYAKLTQPELSEKVRGVISQQGISLLERNINTESAYIVQLAVACGVSPVWLATGSGEMVEHYHTLTPEMEHHLKVMQSLPDYARTEVIRDAIKTQELIDKATSVANSNGTTN